MSSPPPSPDPWPPVLRRVAAGDAHALRALYEAFAPRLLGLAVRILGSGAEAEEALQDSFVQVWRQARRFDPERASVETWLFLIVRRRCIDRLRRARGQPPRHAFPQEEVLDKLVDFAPGPGEAAAQADHPAVRQLRSLPPRQREALELAFFDGYTQAEIAALKNRPLGTVKSDMRRALERLRQGGHSHG